MPNPPQPLAGWYPYPGYPSWERWWDGQMWTAQWRPLLASIFRRVVGSGVLSVGALVRV